MSTFIKTHILKVCNFLYINYTSYTHTHKECSENVQLKDDRLVSQPINGII